MSEISLTMLIKKESNIIDKAHWLKRVGNILAKTKSSEIITKNKYNGWKNN